MYPRMLPQEEPSQSVFYVLKVGIRPYKDKAGFLGRFIQ